MTPGSEGRRAFHIENIAPDPDREVQAEFEFHLERAIEDLVRRGLSEAAAREEAHRRFGDLDRYKRELARIDRQRLAMTRWSEWWFAARQNLVFALRGLRRSPGFSSAVIVTLALGIGANAVMFGVIDRLLLSPPPQVKDPGQVRRLYVRRPDFRGQLFTTATLAYPDVEDWRGSRAFQSVAAYSESRLTLGQGADATRVSASFVTPSLFPLLGVKPGLGRFFDEADDRADAGGVAVISHGFWQRRFGGDPGVVGRVLRLGEGSYTVIGIAPRGFSGLDLRAIDVWLPLHAAVREDGPFVDRRGYYWVSAVARLRPDVSVTAAEAEATRLHRLGRREQIDEGNYSPKASVVAAPLIVARGPLASNESVVSRWLAGVSLAVLLIACANVANLLLARGSRRQREIGIRLAMGISRGRLAAQLITESVLLAALGGGGALVLAAWGSGLLRGVLLPGVAWSQSPVSVRVLVFTAAVAILAGLISGLAPVLQANRPNLTDSLKVGARGGFMRRSRTRIGLQVAQAMLSVVLLVGAGLFLRSLQRVSSQDLGMDTRNVVLARLEPEAGAKESAQLREFYQGALERLETIPGIEKAALATSIPMWNMWAEYFAVPGIDSLPRPPTGGPYVNAVTPDYFEVLGMRVVRGRGLSEADVEGAPRVTVINESMARELWPGQNPLGRCVIIGSADAPCTEVVGVVADSHQQGVIEEAHWLYFVPFAQPFMEFEPTALLARASRDPEELSAVVRQALSGSVSGTRLVTVWPFQELIDPQLRSWRLGATMFTVFGVLALVVAAVGLYSLLSFYVAQRNHEIGVRTALGATQERIVGLVLRQAILLSAAGIVLGLVVVLVAGRAIAPLLFGTTPHDPLVLGGVALTLLAVATLAATLPAWRATRVDPCVAMRAE